MSPSAAPPTPQEIQRKLSVHSVSRPKATTLTLNPVSGTESDSDSLPTPDVTTPHNPMSSISAALHVTPSSSQPPLTSIAERRSGSGGEDTEDEEDVVEGGWKSADIPPKPRNSADESVIKSGYLWKKGERRKTWKKRWFVLRSAHLAYYKSSAEYQLLRLLELSDVHSCTQVNLKRHDNTFGLISPTRTFYLQASSPQEVQSWVQAIEEARQTLLATSTQNSASTPIAIPKAKQPTKLDTTGRSTSRASIPLSSSPPQVSYGHVLTSSDSEDALPSNYQPSQQIRSAASPTQSTFPISPSKTGVPVKDPTKVIVSGYLMKCGSKRRNWRKRWFVLTEEKLIYSGSHMDTKPHRQFPFSEILDALEYDLPPSLFHKQHGHPSSQAVVSPASSSGAAGYPELDGDHSTHTFKIITTKRTLLLCAPSEDDEIKWLGAIRALITRRVESGQVPGKASKSASVSQTQNAQAAPHQNDGGAAPGSSTSATAGSTGAASGSGGIKAKVRRLSGAGHGQSHPEEMREAKTS
ncbi:hypothetical protein CVT24_009064 [Panaeolus cyanescens]|uniref:PH domain-containing protein n=1 Tax=Panaeolus cyanescens TaxID=181874 RepID=A0A409VAF2_9AGAR|nr:hypothetical protein CVT24_009064 [Panaeolus cyanescens]